MIWSLPTSQASSSDPRSLTLPSVFTSSNIPISILLPCLYTWSPLPEIFFLTPVTWAIFIHPLGLGLNVTSSKRSFLRSPNQVLFHILTALMLFLQNTHHNRIHIISCVLICSIFVLPYSTFQDTRTETRSVLCSILSVCIKQNKCSISICQIIINTLYLLLESGKQNTFTALFLWSLQKLCEVNQAVTRKG